MRRYTYHDPVTGKTFLVDLRYGIVRERGTEILFNDDASNRALNAVARRKRDKSNLKQCG